MGWAEKSAYLLRLKKSAQAEVLAAFGLAAPIAEGDAVAFLRAAHPQPTTRELEEMKRRWLDFMTLALEGEGQGSYSALLCSRPTTDR